MILKKICIFLLCSLVLCLEVYAKTPSKKPTHNYRSDLDNVLEEDRIAFDPVLVEDTIKTVFNEEIYDMKKAADTYDQIAYKNNGYMSIAELFFVCLSAHKDIDLVNTIPVANWDVCKNLFILPLLEQANMESFIDDEIIEAYNGHAFNQPCSPAERDTQNLTNNAICTSGKYADIDPAFEKAMITKFRTEGGCTNVQKDGCHRTCYGVCSGNKDKNGIYRVYNEKLERDYRNKTNYFTREDAEDVAYNDHYIKYNFNLLPDAIRGDVFMAHWGTGKTATSIDLLQQVLGVPVTHIVDEETISAAENYPGNLRKAFLKARWRSMQTIAQNMVSKGRPDFSNGWAKGFIVYLRNGCHTIPKIPLYRDETTMAACPK